MSGKLIANHRAATGTFCRQPTESVRPHKKGQHTQILSGDSNTWKQIIDAIPDLIYILDTQYRIIWANCATCDKLDLPVEDVVGKNCYHLVHDRNTPPPDCPFEKAVKGKSSSYTTEIFEKNLGGLFLVSVSP